MYLVDTNILMYAAGAPHANKEPSVQLLQLAAQEEVDATISMESLQEILHRSRRIKRWKDGRQVYDLARQIFPQPIGVDADVLDVARGLMDDYAALMARDALHAALVLAHSLEGIISYDTDFDRVKSIRRLEPADFT